jgi:hypothetical protein
VEENRISKTVLYMNLGTRLRGRLRNIWQDGVREAGRVVGGGGCQEKVHKREEWKKLLRTAMNRRILRMPMECMNESSNSYFLSLVLSSARLYVHGHANFDHLATMLRH